MTRYRASRKDIRAYLFGIANDLRLLQEWIANGKRPVELRAYYPTSVIEKWKTPLDYLERTQRELCFFAQDIDWRQD